MQHRKRGRRYSSAAVAVYALAVLFVPMTWGGSLTLAPLGALLAALAWHRDRPSKMRALAYWLTGVASVLALLLLVFHLIWGDLS